MLSHDFLFFLFFKYSPKYLLKVFKIIMRFCHMSILPFLCIYFLVSEGILKIPLQCPMCSHNSMKTMDSPRYNPTGFYIAQNNNRLWYMYKCSKKHCWWSSSIFNDLIFKKAICQYTNYCTLHTYGFVGPQMNKSLLIWDGHPGL